MKYPKLRFKSEEIIEVEDERIVTIKGEIRRVKPLKEGSREETIAMERIDGVFCNRALWLDDNYDWVIGKDDLGQLVLLCLKKET